MKAYCVKCRKKVEMENPKQVVLKNKRKAVKGSCPRCGTSVQDRRFIRMAAKTETVASAIIAVDNQGGRLAGL